MTHGILLLRLKKTICSKKRQLRESPGFSIISSLVLNKAVHVAGSQSRLYNQKWAKALVLGTPGLLLFKVGARKGNKAEYLSFHLNKTLMKRILCLKKAFHYHWFIGSLNVKFLKSLVKIAYLHKLPSPHSSCFKISLKNLFGYKQKFSWSCIEEIV